MTTSYRSTQPIIADSELPAQTDATNGQALISNGVTASWQYITAMIGTNMGQVPPHFVANTILPDQLGNDGKVLSTTGSNVVWVDAPSVATSTTVPDVRINTSFSMELNPSTVGPSSIITMTATPDVDAFGSITGWNGHSHMEVIITEDSALLPVGTRLTFVQAGAPIRFVLGNVSGVTFTRSGWATIDRYNTSTATLIKASPTLWVLSGDVQSID